MKINLNQFSIEQINSIVQRLSSIKKLGSFTSLVFENSNVYLEIK